MGGFNKSLESPLSCVNIPTHPLVVIHYKHGDSQLFLRKQFTQLHYRYAPLSDSLPTACDMIAYLPGWVHNKVS